MAEEIGGTDRAPCCADLSTSELVKTINAQEAVTPSFILNTFYRNVVRSDKDKVVIQSQKSKTDTALAPFVCPCVEAPNNDGANFGWQSTEITPAYIKEKTALNACHENLSNRGFGEDCSNQLTRAQKRDAHVSQLLQGQLNRIIRREEWMGVQGLLKGGYQVSGDKYPAQTIRMPRWDDAALAEFADSAGCGKSVLDYRIYEHCTPEQNWENLDIDIVSQIEDIIAWLFSNASHDTTDILLGTDAAKCIRANKGLRDLIKCAAELGLAGAAGNFESLFGFERPIADGNAKFLGTLMAGSGINLWTYSGTYSELVCVDNAGEQLPRDEWYKVETPFVPKDTAIFIDNSDTTSGLDGTRFYGSIIDLDSDMAPVARHVKTWSQPDPSCWNFLTQSAPLVLPCNADGAFAICVTGSKSGSLCLQSKGKKTTAEPFNAEKLAAKGYEVTGQKITDNKTGKALDSTEAKKRVSVSDSQYNESVSRQADVSSPK